MLVARLGFADGEAEADALSGSVMLVIVIAYMTFVRDGASVVPRKATRSFMRKGAQREVAGHDSRVLLLQGTNRHEHRRRPEERAAHRSYRER
jgi:hypothetical protein